MTTTARDRFGAVGISVRNLDASVDFYTRVMGMVSLQTFHLADMDEVVVGFEGSRASAIVLMQHTTGAPDRNHGDAIKLVFYVQDPTAVAASIRAEGCEIVLEPGPVESLAGAVVGFAKDPDGYLIELLPAPVRADKA